MIRAELTRTPVLTRWRCHLCGGHTEKHSVLCEVPNSHPTLGGFRICERCLKTRDFDAKLAEQAAAHEAHAAALRAVIGTIDAPTFEEWQRAEALSDAVWIMSLSNDPESLSDADYVLSVLHDPDSPYVRVPAVSFEEVMTWPREKQDEFIAAAKARNDEAEEVARAEIAAWGDSGIPF